MHEVWGDDVAAPALIGGDAVDSDVEAAFGHVADLGVRMGMERSHCTFVEAEGDEHEFRALGENGAAVAGRDLGPDRVRGDVESFANFRCHEPCIAANVPQTNPRIRSAS